MKIEIKKLLTPLLFLALPALVQAQLTFTTNSGAITITGYNGPAGAVVIPAATNGYPVTSIKEGAFSFSDLTSVSFPNTVTNVGQYAFSVCMNLTDITVDPSNPVYSSLNGVLFDKAQETLLRFPAGLGRSYTIPNSVTYIWPLAFSDCGDLTSVLIGNSVTVIGEAAFGGSGLTSVTIPSSVAVIVPSAFNGCTNLTNITVEASNPVYSSLSGVLFDKAQVTLLHFPRGLGGSYAIPNSVTDIFFQAFVRSGLTNVTIPNNVTVIEDNAFSGASLTSVTIPTSVSYIGNDAFESCSNLKSVYFQGNAPPSSLGAVFPDTPAIVYYLPGATGWGSTFGGVPAVLWNPVINTSDPDFGVGPGGFGFNTTGTTNIPIVVEASTNPGISAWLPLQTLNLTNGLFYFSDPQWTNYPGRFYRIRSP